ncbi:hypothetical protein [Streptomyces sp. NPDC020362]|uniref:hypothetical protein n=1 Tax=unclassified Streptomyces TaxID=2593676 RepID=UPI0033CABAD7
MYGTPYIVSDVMTHTVASVGRRAAGLAVHPPLAQPSGASGPVTGRLEDSSPEKTTALVEAVLTVIDRCLEMTDTGTQADAVEAVDFPPAASA